MCPTLKYIKQKLTGMKEEIDNNTVTAEALNKPLSTMDTSSREKINTETSDLNNTLNQMDLTNI